MMADVELLVALKGPRNESATPLLSVTLSSSALVHKSPPYPQLSISSIIQLALVVEEMSAGVEPQRCQILIRFPNHLIHRRVDVDPVV